MPRYFFDLADIADSEGEILPDLRTAQVMAIQILAEVLPTRAARLVEGVPIGVSVREAASVVWKVNAVVGDQSQA